MIKTSLPPKCMKQATHGRLPSGIRMTVRVSVTFKTSLKLFQAKYERKKEIKSRVARLRNNENKIKRKILYMETRWILASLVSKQIYLNKIKLKFTLIQKEMKNK